MGPTASLGSRFIALWTEEEERECAMASGPRTEPALAGVATESTQVFGRQRVLALNTHVLCPRNTTLAHGLEGSFPDKTPRRWSVLCNWQRFVLRLSWSPRLSDEDRVSQSASVPAVLMPAGTRSVFGPHLTREQVDTRDPGSEDQPGPSGCVTGLESQPFARAPTPFGGVSSPRPGPLVWGSGAPRLDCPPPFGSAHRTQTR